MSDAIPAYPLQWPAGWPRTEPGKRKGTSEFKVQIGKAIDELYVELERLGAKHIVLSSNLSLTQAMRPYTKQRQPDDPGIAVYFEWKGKPRCMARDAYTDWRDNIRSLGLAINAFRALDRHGGAVMLERAFEGLQGLPDPETAGGWRWQDVLGVGANYTLEECERRYKQERSKAHRAGETDRYMQLQRAIEQAREELKS